MRAQVHKLQKSNAPLQPMKKYNQIKERMWLYLAAGMAAAIWFGTSPVLKAQQAKTDSAEKKTVSQAGQPTTSPENKQPVSGAGASATAKDAANKKARPAPKQLSGAEIYSMHCARCHPERYPNERTSAQW